MARGRRRKIEVPTVTQPQFELGDTAEDIERRREREGRDASASVLDTSRDTESEKSALHKMLLISLRAPVLSDDSLQSRLPPLLQIQS